MARVNNKVSVEKSSPKTVIPQAAYIPAWKAYLLLMIAACWSPVSQMALTPTHGSIPAAHYHFQLTATLLLLTVPLDVIFLNILPIQEKPFFLPVLAFSVPMVQYFVTPLTFKFGLGPTESALVVEILTYGLIVALTLNIIWPSFRRFVATDMPQVVQTFGPPLIASGFLSAFEGFMMNRLPELYGTSEFFSRAFSPIILALATALLLPSRYLMFALFPFLHTLLLNPHTPIPPSTWSLESTLASVNYTLLDRKEGPTGYVSVLQNNQAGFRVMRCDHSLLGGNWLPGVGDWPFGAQFIGKRNNLVAEPVYTVFVNLEAVRLVQDVKKDGIREIGGKPDEEAKALVIGLGIGTTPAALISHGIETHIMEIDPVVYDFARDYFALPPKHEIYIQDATTYIHDFKPIVDYIVHDVFTGGAEPAELFTFEFLTELSMRLQKEGVIAINYAGDLFQAPASLIARTVLAVFPSCRIFREVEPPKDPAIDFTNLIFFCHKGTQQFEFREPVEKDFLGTMSRSNGLVPKHEVEASTFDLEGGKDGLPKVLKVENVDVLKKWRTPGAAGHWDVMRTVIPPLVWHNW